MKADKKERRAAEAATAARKLIELEAQLPCALYSAHAAIDKAGDALMASAVVVSLTALGGRQITGPFAISDGFSAETIAAIKADIVKSLMRQTIYMPRTLRDAVEQCRAEYLAEVKGGP